MIKSALAYSFVLAVFAFFLDWLEYRYMMRAFSTEAFVVVIALFFTAFGAWTAWRLTPSDKAHSAAPDVESSKSGGTTQIELTQVGLTQRENEVLHLLAQGHTNKEIARDLGLAPDTVKTHLSNVYRKLKVNRRTQAIRRAQSLLVIP